MTALVTLTALGVLAAGVAFVLITHHRQCWTNRAGVERLEQRVDA
jgi:hypothetical protein